LMTAPPFARRRATTKGIAVVSADIDRPRASQRMSSRSPLKDVPLALFSSTVFRSSSGLREKNSSASACVFAVLKSASPFAYRTRHSSREQRGGSSRSRKRPAEGSRRFPRAEACSQAGSALLPTARLRSSRPGDSGVSPRCIATRPLQWTRAPGLDSARLAEVGMTARLHSGPFRSGRDLRRPPRGSRWHTRGQRVGEFESRPRRREPQRILGTRYDAQRARVTVVRANHERLPIAVP